MESKSKNDKFKIDFLGIGVPRAATTWIYRCLQKHPEICTSSEKETRYFRNDYKKGINYYKKYFQHCKQGQIKGEYAPGYFFDGKELVKRVKNHNPNIKLILCFRNPIERLYSGYLFSRSRGSKQSLVSFEEAIKENFLNTAHYHKNLENWYEEFPEEQIFICLFEDIKNNPKELTKNIYKFLAVDQSFVPELAQKKLTALEARKPALNG